MLLIPKSFAICGSMQSERDGPASSHINLQFSSAVAHLRCMRNSYTMKLEFLARLERFFAHHLSLGSPARILRAGRQTLTERWKLVLPGKQTQRLCGREKKCSAGFQPAKVLLTQKELTRLTCRRDAGATIFPHVLRLCGDVFGCGRRPPL